MDGPNTSAESLRGDHARAELGRKWPAGPSAADYPVLRDLVLSLPGVSERADQVALLSIGGSHGYGLATEDSDLDVRGMFMMPTRELIAGRLDPSVEPKPAQMRPAGTDVVIDELGRMAQHAAQARPNMLEVLWAPVVHASPAGRALIEHRELFLSQRVREGYAGFAAAQKRKALDRVAGTSDMKKRRKFVRHMFRLHLQGLQLLESGTMDYRLNAEQAQRIHELELIDDQMLEREFALLDARMTSCDSPLPEQPDWDAIHELIYELRIADLRARGEI
jgi:predicted nucleotidyltransferase